MSLLRDPDQILPTSYTHFLSFLPRFRIPRLDRRQDFIAFVKEKFALNILVLEMQACIASHVGLAVATYSLAFIELCSVRVVVAVLALDLLCAFLKSLPSDERDFLLYRSLHVRSKIMVPTSLQILCDPIKSLETEVSVPCSNLYGHVFLCKSMMYTTNCIFSYRKWELC